MAAEVWVWSLVQGAVHGAGTGLLVGTIALPFVGSLVGVIAGETYGLVAGLVCGTVLAGYVGLRRGVLGHDPMPVARTLPRVALILTAAVAVVAQVLGVPAPNPRLFGAVATPVLLATGWFAARTVGRRYLRAEGYPVEAAGMAFDRDTVRRFGGGTPGRPSG